ncbi:MAG: hypothetical protein ABEK00_02025 [Candidatus Nanohaloarchaea archaeon]
MKGALESGLGEIILTVLIAAVISGAMFGPLGAKIGQGFKEAEKFTDVKTKVTVDDKETLGDLSQYVFWRAWGCEHVSSETFQGLADTSLGANPSCAGVAGTVAADINNLYANSGNDMEGKFSRVNFVINDTITLKTGLGFGPDGKSATLLGVSTGDRFGKSGYSDWIWSGCTKYQPGVGDSWGGSWESKGPPYSFFTLFFKNGGGSERIQSIGTGKTIEERYADKGNNDPLYCDEWNDGPWLTKPSSHTGNPKDHEETGGNFIKVKLCPGDKGYIETRKGYPNIAGEYGRRTATVNNGNLYGMIQITSMNSSCTMEGAMNPVQPYEGPESSNQIYVRGVNGDLPNVEHFEFRTAANTVGISHAHSWRKKGYCQIVVSENDPAIDDKGFATFGPGTSIGQQGSLPDLMNARARHISNGATYDEKNYYKSINFDGSAMNDGGRLLKHTPPNYENSLYGDILCGFSGGSDDAKWHICYSGTDAKTVRAYGGRWQCNGDSGEWQIEEPMPDTRTITDQYDFFVHSSDESEVLTETGSGLKFRPGQSSDWDKIFYQKAIPLEEKKIEVDLKFQKRGHLKVDFTGYYHGDTESEPAGGIPNAYILMKSNGDIIFMDGDTHDTGVDYTAGDELTISVTQTDPVYQDSDDFPTVGYQTEFQIKKGGTTVWTRTTDYKEHSYDQMQIESWNEWGDSTTDKPIVTIQQITATRYN